VLVALATAYLLTRTVPVPNVSAEPVVSCTAAKPPCRRFGRDAARGTDARRSWRVEVRVREVEQDRHRLREHASGRA
jgi:hypothetical protein